ncbi:hypothetical protein SCUP234_04680 [Seiridium cupressi]
MNNSQLQGRDMVDMMEVINANYPLLWDLLNGRRREELSSEAAFDRLQSQIFSKLERHIHINITDYWHPDHDIQENATWPIFLATRSLGPNFEPYSYTHNRHRHHALLPDWRLNYSFTSTGHESETFGVPRGLIDMVNKAAHAQDLAEAELNQSAAASSQTQPRRPQGQSSTLVSDLSSSPTAQTVEDHHHPSSMTHHCATHGCRLSMPLPLTEMADNEPDVLSRIHAYLAIARNGFDRGYRGVFRTNVDRAIAINKCSTMDQWLRDYANLPVAIGLLERIKEKIQKSTDAYFGVNDFDYDDEEEEDEEEDEEEEDNADKCLFCMDVARANTIMLKGRLLSYPPELLEEFKAVFRRVLSNYHDREETDSTVTRYSFPMPFEHQIQLVANEIDCILSPAYRHSENDGYRPHRINPPAGRAVLGRITNTNSNPVMDQPPPQARQNQDQDQDHDQYPTQDEHGQQTAAIWPHSLTRATRTPLQANMPAFALFR